MNQPPQKPDKSTQQAEGSQPLLVRLGIWAWGSVTLILAAAALMFLVAASFYIEAPDGKAFTGGPAWMPAVYLVLKDHNQLIAAILAVSGLAWSYFFQWKK